MCDSNVSSAAGFIKGRKQFPKFDIREVTLWQKKKKKYRSATSRSKRDTKDKSTRSTRFKRKKLLDLTIC